MWSDNESQVDLLRFNYLNSVIQQIIIDPKLLPTTIGLFGDWGSGKSTLIKMLERDLRKKDKTLCLSFNGWLFEGYDDARTALMGSILDGIKEYIEKDKNLLEKAGDKLKSLLKKVNWFQTILSAAKYGVPLVAGLPHLTIATAATDIIGAIKKDVADIPAGVKQIEVESIKKYFKDDESLSSDELRKTIRDFRKEFEELITLSELNSIVIFIDDLDRCLPSTIIETLEAIRLFLFVPKTAFVIGADERLVEYAVRKRFPELPGSKVEVGRDYLEKMVQVPIRIPPLSSADTESFMNLLFAEKRLAQEKYGLICDHVSNFKTTEFNQKSFDLECAKKILGAIPAELDGDLDLIAKIAPVLTGGLGGSPRRAKRFLNTLLLRVDMGKLRGLDLKVSVMAKLMVLEYIKPEFFKDLARMQESQAGKPKELIDLETPTKLDKAPKIKTATEDINPIKKEVVPNSVKSSSGETDIWLSDQWMETWISLFPKLSNIDLRPYFYIAHDKVGALGQLQMRLSPRAQEVLNLLISPGTTSRAVGLKEGGKLALPDATAVFEALAEKIVQAESLSKNQDMTTMFEFVGHQKTLIPQLISLFKSLPETKLVAEIIPMFKGLLKDSPQFKLPIIGLFKDWGKSTTKKAFADMANQSVIELEK
jgi:KAP family P-loop domain